MKILLFLVVVFVLLWLLRGATGRRRGDAPRPPQAPQEMIACAHCGVHLPRDEALPGRGGVFCGDAHRAAFEKAQNRAP
ncbi:MAG TPA: PP0621 family protein [Caldimonas sp.]|nr:PP0621 family protein [Caldimonas sp.]